MDSVIGTPAVEIWHLRLVAAVVEHGSLTTAARALHLTQPALSHQLRELEARLHVPLFVRTARRMLPTPAGERLARVARAVLAEVRAFEREVVDGDLAAAQGTVTLAAECDSCYHWLPGALRAFRERWPGVEVRLAPEHTGDPLGALVDGAIDLAIVRRRAADRHIRLDPLFDDELVVVMAPDHPLARHPWVDPEELADEPLVLHAGDDGRSSLVAELFDPVGVEPRQVTRLRLTEAIVELVAAGLGVSVLPRWAVAPMLRAGSLEAVRLTEHGFLRQWLLARRAAETTSAHEFDLVELLRRHVAPGPFVEATRIA